MYSRKGAYDQKITYEVPPVLRSMRMKGVWMQMNEILNKRMNIEKYKENMLKYKPSPLPLLNNVVQ
jgi:hypothetical protein